MELGEKPVGSGVIWKAYGLSRGDLEDLEIYDGLDYIESKSDRPKKTNRRQHRWYLSEVAEAKKRREVRRQKEAEKRRLQIGWDNSHTASYLAECNAEMKEAKKQIRAAKAKAQSDYIQIMADRTEKEVLKESQNKKRRTKERSEWEAKCYAVM